MSIIHYILRNYYLSNICKGNITKEEVADIYSTTAENVEKAVQNYQETKNPFRSASSDIKQGRIQIFISFVSAILVLFTLFEMQAERNAAYMPNISINGTGIKFAWDKDHNLVEDISFFDEEDLNTWNDFGSSYTKGFYVKMAILNTGVGVAKDLNVDWLYKENIPLFQELFVGNSDVSIGMTDRLVRIKLKDKNGMEFYYSASGKREYGFLKADLSQGTDLVVPAEYIQLYELAYAYDLWQYIPDLRYRVIYEDVQGKEYEKSFVIHPQPLIFGTSSENSGYGIVDLKVAEQKAGLFSFFRKYRYILYCVAGFTLVIVMLLVRAVLFEIKRRRKIVDKEEQPSSLNGEKVGKDQSQD